MHYERCWRNSKSIINCQLALFQDRNSCFSHLNVMNAIIMMSDFGIYYHISTLIYMNHCDKIIASKYRK